MSSRLPNINNLPLVSSANPARDDGTFDHERCVTLHNFLVKYGWVGAGKPLRDLTYASFFGKHGDDADEVRDRLQPQVASFLMSIIIPEETFFIWVKGVSEPSEMFQAEQLLPDEADINPNRYLVLYPTNPGLGEHSVGLIYDQVRNVAVLILGIEDIEFVFPAEMHAELWQPLETILSNWIEMIRIGKVTTHKAVGNSCATESDEEGFYTEGSYEDTDSEDGKSESEGEESESDDFDPNNNREYEPWVWHSYSEAQVDSTVSAFDRLVTAIEDRLPQRPATTEQTPLLSDTDLDTASVPQACFVRAFLTQARRPRFKNIAPGLLMPTRETFAVSQKFTPRLEAVLEERDPDQHGTLVPPVLIFATADGRRADLDSLDDELSNPFVKHLALEDGGNELPTGVYSESVEQTDIDSAEEGFHLILPFALGQHAKKSDGSLIEEGSVAGLFQHGYKPFGGEWWRAQRLERLFVHPASLALLQLASHPLTHPLDLANDPVHQGLINMHSTEIRSTFSQELGALLRHHLTSKLTELAINNALPLSLRNHTQRILKMLTVSYGCAILNPSTGTREVTVPAVLLLADGESDVDMPLVMLVVNFSSSSDDQTIARLLDLYPGTTIVRVDIPYLNPEARFAACSSGSTASAYTSSYDVIIRANTIATTPASHTSKDSSSPKSKLRFLARNLPLLQQHGKEGKEESLEIPLCMLLPDLAWRVSLAHPAAGAAGLLSIKLRYASLRRCLQMAATRQKNMDLLRMKSTGNRSGFSAMSPSGSDRPSSRGIHTLAVSRTSGLNTSRTCAFNTAAMGSHEGPVAMHRGSGGLHSGIAKLRTFLGFGWRFGRRGRC